MYSGVTWIGSDTSVCLDTVSVSFAVDVGGNASGSAAPSACPSKNPDTRRATESQLHSRSTHARARAPNARATSGRDTSRFMYSKR